MANARQASLYEQRTQYRTPFTSETRRILAPAQTGLSTIAKQSAANETDIMIAKYNSGQVSNEEMKAFLQTQLSNPYVSASDKTQIQTKLIDFDTLIQKDKLEATFKSAPDNTLQKEQAAQALAQFYTQRASTMQPGTPAHSQAMENAGVWEQNVQSIRSSVSRQQRKNLENSLLQKVNQLPTSSSQRSQAQAEMYKQLYDMAIRQGDEEDAQVYAAKMEQAQTYAEQYAAAEGEQANKQSIKQFAAEQDLLIAKLTDNTPEELKSKAEKAYAVAEKYAAIGDQLNYTKYMTIGTQAEEKYNKKLESVSAAEAAKMAFENEKNYSDNIRLAQERYIRGQYDASQFSSAEEEYKDSLRKSVEEWKGTIEGIYNTAISMDANEKISWRGKNRRVGDVIDEIEKEYGKIEGIENAIESGSVMLKELPVSEKMGKNTPKYELVDIRNLSEEDQQLLAPDESGILHQGEMGKREIDKETYNALMQEDNFRKDLDYNSKTGKYYQDSGLQFSVIDPETGQSYVQTPDDKGQIMSYKSIRDEARGLGYKDNETIDFAPKNEFFENQATMTADEVAKSLEKKKKIREQEPKVEKNIIEKIAETTDSILPKGKVTSPLPEKRTIGQQLVDTVTKSPIEAGKEIIENIVEPKKQPLVDTVKTPVNVTKAVQSGGITVDKQQPKQQAPIVYNTPAPKQPITYGQTPAVNINKSIQTGGLTIDKVQPPKVVAPTPAPKPKAPSIGTVLTGAVGQAANKIKSFFKW